MKKIIVIQPYEKEEAHKKVREAIKELTERIDHWDIEQIVISIEIIENK